MLAQKSRVIGYASRVLNPVKRNYAITERECLAVVWVLLKFPPYFEEYPVKIIIDHSTLIHLMTGKHLSSQIIRWAIKIVGFNIVIKHRAGTTNVVVNCLSHMHQGLEPKFNPIQYFLLYMSMVIHLREEFERF